MASPGRASQSRWAHLSAFSSRPFALSLSLCRFVLLGLFCSQLCVCPKAQLACARLLRSVSSSGGAYYRRERICTRCALFRTALALAPISAGLLRLVFVSFSFSFSPARLRSGSLLAQPPNNNNADANGRRSNSQWEQVQKWGHVCPLCLIWPSGKRRPNPYKDPSRARRARRLASSLRASATRRPQTQTYLANDCAPGAQMAPERAQVDTGGESKRKSTEIWQTPRSSRQGQSARHEISFIRRHCHPFYAL